MVLIIARGSLCGWVWMGGVTDTCDCHMTVM